MTSIKTGILRRQTDAEKTPAGRDELIDFIANDLYTTKADAGLILDSVTRAVVDLSGRHGAVKVPNLGQFKVLDTPAREGRNPRSGEVVEIAPGRRVTFRAAKFLKTSINK
jgi:DNA-binding protein HU-beta